MYHPRGDRGKCHVYMFSREVVDRMDDGCFPVTPRTIKPARTHRKVTKLHKNHDGVLAKLAAFPRMNRALLSLHVAQKELCEHAMETRQFILRSLRVTFVVEGEQNLSIHDKRDAALPRADFPVAAPAFRGSGRGRAGWRYPTW